MAVEAQYLPFVSDYPGSITSRLWEFYGHEEVFNPEGGDTEKSKSNSVFRWQRHEICDLAHHVLL